MIRKTCLTAMAVVSATVSIIGGAIQARAEALISSVSPQVSAGTLGIGPEIDTRLANLPLGLRLGANFFSFDRNISTSDITYRGKANLANGGLIADWYPFITGFRLSAGLKVNGNEATVTAIPATGGTVTVNHQTYSAAGSSLAGKIGFDTFAPYAGVGFAGQIFGGPTLGFDLGAMFHGTPKATLNASGPITTVPGFAANLAQEQQNLEDKVRDFWVYPVVDISLGWRF